MPVALSFRPQAAAPGLPRPRPSSCRRHARLVFASATPEDDKPDNSDGRVESLFAAELARRSAGGTGPEELPPPPAWAPGASGRRPSTTTGDDDEPPPPQLLASRALSSEGLSGLVPRARALLTLGFAFSGAFVGLAAVAAGAFIALALAAGPSFVHGGKEGAGLPPYVDPYALLDDPSLLGTDGPNGAMPPPPPGYRKKAAAPAEAAPTAPAVVDGGGQ